MTERQIERLYELLRKLERQGDTETAAALRQAIFIAENS